jgi:hypothetical protein
MQQYQVSWPKDQGQWSQADHAAFKISLVGTNIYLPNQRLDPQLFLTDFTSDYKIKGTRQGVKEG